MTTRAPADSRVRIPLRWRDMDELGHLNQAVYHELLEEVRAAAFERVIALGDGWNFVLARVELNYRREIRHTDGHVDLVARVAAIGRTSVTLDHEVLLPDGATAADGRSVLVAWDTEARAARALTDAERKALEPDEGDPAHA